MITFCVANCVCIYMRAFCDIAPCCLGIDRRFIGAYSLHHHSTPDDGDSTHHWNVGIFQKALIFILAAVRTWYHAWVYLCLGYTCFSIFSVQFDSWSCLQQPSGDHGCAVIVLMSLTLLPALRERFPLTEPHVKPMQISQASDWLWSVEFSRAVKQTPFLLLPHLFLPQCLPLVITASLLFSRPPAVLSHLT
jgi:hypothetical protein